MKFDKETILKQRFWFLLALAVPLTLVAFFILMTKVRGDINNNRKKLEGDLAGAGKGSPIRNQQWVDQMEAKAKKMAAEEEKVWREAYDKQKDFSTWPKSIEEKFRFKDGYFATEIKVERSKDKAPVGKFPANDNSHFHAVGPYYDNNSVIISDDKQKKKTFQ